MYIFYHISKIYKRLAFLKYNFIFSASERLLLRNVFKLETYEKRLIISYLIFKELQKFDATYLR